MSEDNGWRPIESAPAATGSDDDHVLVFGAAFPKPAVVQPDGDWWRMRARQGSKAVTHWMPLPPAPEPVA